MCEKNQRYYSETRSFRENNNCQYIHTSKLECIDKTNIKGSEAIQVVIHQWDPCCNAVMEGTSVPDFTV